MGDVHLLETRLMLPEDDSFTPKELARYWKCNEKTVRDMIHRGELEAFQIRGRFRVKREAVARYEEANRYRNVPLSANPYA